MPSIKFKLFVICAGAFGLALWFLAIASGAAAPAIAVPAATGYVNDRAGVLTAEEKDRLENLSRLLDEKTSAQMAFLIMPSIAPYDYFTYGIAVFDQWQLGQKGKDNGLLILLAMQERSIRIITGYGLEGILPDGKVGRYRDEYLVPYLKNNQTAQGLYAVGAAMAADIAAAANQTLEGVARPSADNGDRRSALIMNLVLLVVVLIFSGIAGVINRRRGGRSGGFWWGGPGGGPFMGGGGGFGGNFGGGGFGGFGGGFSGGGGAGGRW
jgi:uncharacterized protein